ncbi:PucR family transcriptional regulator [Intestinibacter sp.]|uniref:PucR family transcriptional regulator n=1 Tax=Intestinibacter sp. TaxID=1965304 RepID=UPI002A75A62B|nr:PucR family transcriptional regulator [Intestinibacter sp.]MDY2737170.1 PucR family transcriptional regulator [Intestinibacter sp.]MDY4575298.1 PucR family transcriptional regulator [Intestinibacter sp.]
MKITVNDCLKLPILSKATVVAGKGGLNRVVSGISVLETSNIIFDEYSYKSLGGELVVSGFITCYDDINGLLRCVESFSKSADAGLIIFYLGIYLKEIPEQVIRLADELDFPIIVMPKNRDDIPYSYVIYEVMQLIFENKLKSNAWQKDNYEIDAEFVKAILDEDKISLHRLSFYIKDKVENLRYMKYIHFKQDIVDNHELKKEVLNNIRQYYYKRSIKAYAAVYEDDIVVLITDKHDIQQDDVCDLMNNLEDISSSLDIVYLDGLDSLESIISAYKLCRYTIKSVPLIFKIKKYYLRHDLLFTEQCLNLIKEGESDIQYYLSILNKVKKYDASLYKTLESYAIDYNMNVAKTSESLFLHRNSVQYRLNKIKELIGNDKFEFPAINQLMIAMAIKRIRMNDK